MDKHIPYDPMCRRYAKDMNYLDYYLEEDQSREDYIIQEEGTYNYKNGHFLCDECYIKAGMPTAPFPGWKCP
jgi:hypothetical protein